MKKNCWDILNCGRTPNGENKDELGVCPVAENMIADGLNSGNRAGRICWTIGGSFCGGARQGTFSEKVISCMTCDVFKIVREEEDRFVLLLPGQQYQPSPRVDDIVASYS